MVPLGVGIRGVSKTDPLYLSQHGPVRQDRTTQLGPIAPSTPRDHIVDRGKGEALMNEVTVKHGRLQRVANIGNYKRREGKLGIVASPTRAKRFAHHTPDGGEMNTEKSGDLGVTVLTRRVCRDHRGVPIGMPLRKL